MLAADTTNDGRSAHSNTRRQFYNLDGRSVGSVTADGHLLKRVSTTRHMLRKPPAWAVDANHLEQLAAMNGRGVRLVDERGQVWEASLADFDRRGFDVNRGFGQQRGLLLRDWKVTPAGEAA